MLSLLAFLISFPCLDFITYIHTHTHARTHLELSYFSTLAALKIDCMI